MAEETVGEVAEEVVEELEEVVYEASINDVLEEVFEGEVYEAPSEEVLEEVLGGVVLEEAPIEEFPGEVLNPIVCKVSSEDVLEVMVEETGCEVSSKEVLIVVVAAAPLAMGEVMNPASSIVLEGPGAVIVELCEIVPEELLGPAEVLTVTFKRVSPGELLDAIKVLVETLYVAGSSGRVPEEVCADVVMDPALFPVLDTFEVVYKGSDEACCDAKSCELSANGVTEAASDIVLDVFDMDVEALNKFSLDDILEEALVSMDVVEDGAVDSMLNEFEVMIAGAL